MRNLGVPYTDEDIADAVALSPARPSLDALIAIFRRWYSSSPTRRRWINDIGRLTSSCFWRPGIVFWAYSKKSKSVPSTRRPSRPSRKMMPWAPETGKRPRRT